MNRANFVLHYTSEYERDFKKIVRKDKLLASKVLDVSEKLIVNPFSIGLRTHIVRISSLGRVYSSRVNGDIRIFWTLEEEDIILLHRIGGYQEVQMYTNKWYNTHVLYQYGDVRHSTEDCV